jgi:hypothetical protein
MAQTANDKADSNPATQTKGNNADNDNALPCRQQGDATTSRKSVVVALMRARTVVVALVTTVAVAAARSVVVAATVTVPVAAARFVTVDLYASGCMNLDSMLSSSPFVIVGLVLLNDAHRKDRK